MKRIFDLLFCIFAIAFILLVLLSGLAFLFIALDLLGDLVFHIRASILSLIPDQWWIRLLAAVLCLCVVATAFCFCARVFFRCRYGRPAVESCTAFESRIVGEPLQTERCSDGKRKLLRDLTIDIRQHRSDNLTGPEHTIKVVQGFVTDFSSIPTPFHWIVRWSKVDIAGIVHDWLYAKGKVTRACADEIWRMMALSGEHRATPCQANICWLALRLFGGFAWRTHRRNRERVATQQCVAQDRKPTDEGDTPHESSSTDQENSD